MLLTRHLRLPRDARLGDMPGYSHSPLAGLNCGYFHSCAAQGACRRPAERRRAATARAALKSGSFSVEPGGAL